MIRSDAGILAAGLARLAADHLAPVLHALALVRLGRAEAADLGRDLAHDFLVAPRDLDDRRRDRLQLDALGRSVIDGVRVPQAEGQAERLVLCPVPHADDLEHLLEPAGHALDHVGHQRPAEAVQRPVLRVVGGALHQDLLALAPDDHVRVQGAGELALGPLDPDGVAFDVDLDPRGDRDRLLSNARHIAPRFLRVTRRGRSARRPPSRPEPRDRS
jgi:hypothetical protein